MKPTKNEMEFALHLIKQTCEIFVSVKDNEPFDNGVKFCCKVILEKIDELYKGNYNYDNKERSRIK